MSKIRIDYLSDVHLEAIFLASKSHQTMLLDAYAKGLAGDRDCIPNAEQKILVLAGDICNATMFSQVLSVFHGLLKQENCDYDKIYYLLGNHEYYDTSLSHAQKTIQKRIDSDPVLNSVMQVVHHEYVDIGKQYRLLFTPFWYKTNPIGETWVLSHLNDFRLINNHKNKKLTYADVLAEYEASVQFINANLAEDKKNILVTHHATSELYDVNKKYDHTYGFGTPLKDIEHVDRIHACIHGHTHHHGALKYINEYGIPTYAHTLGYLGIEFKLDFDYSMPFLLLEEND